MSILIAKLPSTASIWEICKAGADNQPIFFHYLMRASIHLLGNDQMGVRVPALLGFMVFCWSLYWFVSRRSSGLYGVIALLVASLSGSWFYATDGRPYGLVLGFTGAAAVCWQAIGFLRNRPIAIVGLALSLTLLFNLHYYTPLLLAPFGLAEVVRTLRQRKFDGAVWLAFVLPLLTLLPYIPVVREARLHSGVAGDYISMPAWYASLRLIGGEQMESCIVPLIGIACTFLLYRGFHLPRTSVATPVPTRSETRNLRQEGFVPDLFLIVAFVLFPIVVIIFSKFVTHIFFTRYAAASAFGVDALVAMCLWFGFSGREAPALIAAAILFCAQAYMDVQNWRYSLPPSAVRLDMQRRIPAEAAGSNLPIAVEDSHAFMELYYYTNPDVRRKLVYLTDEPYALRVMNTTFLERMMVGSAPFFGTQVIDYQKFVRSHSEFYVLGGLEWWLGRHLLEDKAQITLLQGGLMDNRGTHAEVLLRVHIPDGSGT